MRHATARRSTSLRPGVAPWLLVGLGLLALAGCRPAPSSPVVLPSGGPATFRPTPTPVPGASEVVAEPTSGGGPQPTVEVPPPIP